MDHQPKQRSQFFLRACLVFLALLFSMSAVAVEPPAVPKPGEYCPSPGILLIAAEDLSTSLDLAMGSRAAALHKNQTLAASELTSVGTTLHLAASRGAAARTTLLIDAIIQSKVNKSFSQVLTWFPLLHSSLLTLPEDATVRAADEWISDAEDILLSNKSGDFKKALKKARHLLSCDGFDIPLQQAIAEQEKLVKQHGREIKSDSYDALLNSLRTTLLYALNNSKK